MARSAGRSMRVFKTELKGLEDDDAARANSSAQTAEPAPYQPATYAQPAAPAYPPAAPAQPAPYPTQPAASQPVATQPAPLAVAPGTPAQPAAVNGSAQPAESAPAQFADPTAPPHA